MTQQEPERIAALDARLSEVTAIRDAENQALASQRDRLVALLAQKERLIAELEASWKSAQKERQRIDAEVARLLAELPTPSRA